METITIAKNNACKEMIVRFTDMDDHNPSLEAVMLFNALIEHLPGGTMTELYWQFVKSARLFDHDAD